MRAARSLRLGTMLALASVASGVAPAIAQPADNKVLAEQLFEQGRELARANQWAEACPKFEASLRYDATLGTRLNLATCFEKVGKLASAWGLFRDSAELARKAGDTARRDYALKHAAALQPRLPRLTIAGPTTPAPGFTVTRDGVNLDLTALGSALYVDPGPHEVTASAPGFAPFKATVSVEEAKTGSVVIPELVPLPKQDLVAPEPRGPQPLPGEKEHEEEEPVGPSDPGRTRKLVGIGVAGGGAVLAGVGFVLGARASSTFSDAKALCGAELICENPADFERGKDLIARARTQATLSTVLVITGAAAAAAGVVVWVTAPRRKRERPEAAVVPVVTDRDLGVAVVGSF